MAEKTINELPRDIRPLYTKGNDALARENFDYAIDLFFQVLVREPAVIDCRKALRRAQQGKAASKSSGFFKKMLSSAGASPLIAKAQMALRSNAADALSIAEQVLNGDPDNSSAHKIIVEAATTLEFPQTKVISLEVLHRLHPKDKSIALQFSAALVAVAEPQRAEQVLVDFLKLMPTDPDVNQALKNASASRTLDEGGYDDLAKGEGSYRDLLRNETEAVELEQEQRIHKSEDVTERLITDYESRLQSDPKNLKLLKQLAELYTQRKQFDRALQYYERIQAVEPGADAAIDRAMAETSVRKFEQEIEKLDPLAPDFNESVERLTAEKQAFQLAACQKRVEKYPTDLAFRYELGVLYFQAGRISEAQKEFQKAQGNPHKRIGAMNYLAQCFARRKIFDLAASTLQDAIKEKLVFDEEKKELIYNLGSVFETMGKKEDAIEQFKTIYKVDTSYRDVEAKVDKYYSGQ